MVGSPLGQFYFRGAIIFFDFRRSRKFLEIWGLILVDFLYRIDDLGGNFLICWRLRRANPETLQNSINKKVISTEIVQIARRRRAEKNESKSVKLGSFRPNLSLQNLVRDFLEREGVGGPPWDNFYLA